MIRRVGVIGAGTMGSGIATNVAQHRLEVVLFDTVPAAVERALEQARAFYDRAVRKGKLDPAEAERANGQLHPAQSLREVARADLVIEAVFEDLGIKSALLQQLAPDLASDTLIATNTSCLRVSDLAANVPGPERFLGLHYFSPAEINPIVEVVRGGLTSAQTAQAAVEFCRTTGKQPLQCKDSYGFAINRFFCPYTNEAARILDDDLASAAQIDLVARELVGAAAGPFAVMNLIKPRINLHAIRNLAPLGSFYEPARSIIEIGQGDRSWELGDAEPLTIGQRRLIADRLCYAIFLPVLQELDEGVATPFDIDRGAHEALRFSRPPCALMDQMGRTEVARILAPVLQQYGLAEPRSLSAIGSLVQ
jgi:3-hydroxybutyryl-CoA dehydrogenase